MKPDYVSADGTVTLYRADCLDVVPHLDDIDACLMDPPYGCGLNYGDSYDDSRPDYWDWFKARLSAIRARCPLVVHTHRNHALKHLHEWDWVGVWNKPGSFGSRIGNSFILPHWEPLFFYGIHHKGTHSDYLADVLTFNPEPAKAGFTGMGRAKWEQDGNGRHPCPKPLPLIRRLIRAISDPCGRILDPFMGSGTTGVACVGLGRRFVGIEISPLYFDLAVRRIEQAFADQALFVPQPVETQMEFGELSP